jgi:hypothetical protein
VGDRPFPPDAGVLRRSHGVRRGDDGGVRGSIRRQVSADGRFRETYRMLRDILTAQAFAAD